MTKTDGKRLISLSTNEQISSEASKGLVEAATVYSPMRSRMGAVMK